MFRVERAFSSHSRGRGKNAAKMVQSMVFPVRFYAIPGEAEAAQMSASSYQTINWLECSP